MATQETVAELVARFLAGRGVRRSYGVTGGEMLAVLGALRAQGIRFILTHHEAAAAYMADTEAQLTGRPGLCLSTLGPGAANLFAGLAQATLERSPVLGITADVTDDERARTTHQVIDITGAMAPVVKYTARVTPENVWQTVPQAWAAATTGRPGAAHLSIPAAVATQPAAPGTWATVQPPTAPEPDEAALDALRVRLTGAIQPAAILGLEGRDPGIAEAFRELVETFDLPVATQVRAKGWFPGNHHLHAGTLASYGSRGVFELLDASDLILGVGMDGVDFILPWQTGAVVHLTARPGNDPTFPQTTIRGPLVPMLRQLADAPRVERPRAGAGRAQAARRKALADLRGREAEGAGPLHGPADGMDIHHVFRSLRQALGPDVALISDIGFHKLYLAQYWDVLEPNGYMVANGLSAMGWALPSAIAYKLVLADRPLVAVAGDGSLLMYAGELETLARVAPSSLVLVVLNDASMSLIRAKAEDLDVEATPNDFGSPDYVALARSFGLRAERARSSKRAIELITEGLRRDAPVVVEVPVDYASYRAMR